MFQKRECNRSIEAICVGNCHLPYWCRWLNEKRFVNKNLDIEIWAEKNGQSIPCFWPDKIKNRVMVPGEEFKMVPIRGIEPRAHPYHGRVLPLYYIGDCLITIWYFPSHCNPFFQFFLIQIIWSLDLWIEGLEAGPCLFRIASGKSVAYYSEFCTVLE